ncbi:MAG: hypothetical protein B6I20_05100 [Bacteroidetes bacterium 4572_117]|nr:MAG: hypothetical protein B6I20_05100 [Bacteroidetes bacterium 4572_117]
MGGMMKSLFVFIQFAGLAIIFVTAPVFNSSYFLLTIEIWGVLLGFWAIIAMKLDNLRIYPDLKENAKLVVSGPYNIIRHPMYFAIILTITPLIIEYFSWLRLVIGIIILIDLIFKLNYEEKLLLNNFTDYGSYTKSTYRLIPYIY